MGIRNVNDGRTNPHAQNFASIWDTGATFWLKQAQQGDILPFAPELDPPSSGYAITQVQDGEVIELSDRWTQSLVLAGLAKQAFTNAAKLWRRSRR